MDLCFQCTLNTTYYNFRLHIKKICSDNWENCEKEIYLNSHIIYWELRIFDSYRVYYLRYEKTWMQSIVRSRFSDKYYKDFFCEEVNPFLVKQRSQILLRLAVL